MPEGTRKLARVLAQEYFNTIDPEYATCCVFNSTIAAGALNKLGLAAEIEPCKMIYTHHGREVVIGFAGVRRPNQWDGHVAVKLGQKLIDCSTWVFRKYHGHDVPAVVVAARMPLRSKLIATVECRGGGNLIWIEPPAEMPPLPYQPPHIIENHASALADQVLKKVKVLVGETPAEVLSATRLPRSTCVYFQ